MANTTRSFIEFSCILNIFIPIAFTLLHSNDQKKINYAQQYFTCNDHGVYLKKIQLK